MCMNRFVFRQLLSLFAVGILEPGFARHGLPAAPGEASGATTDL
jgi:hypothetical protein